MPTDFHLKYNTDLDSELTIARKIILALTLQQLKAKIPVIVSLTGKSSSGKSLAAISIQRLIFQELGINQEEFFNVSNIFTPLEYGQKMNRILYDPDCSKINCVILHEARDVIRAKDWQSLISRVVADVNALSRAIKPLCVIIVSQNIRDITSEVRRTISIYAKTIRYPGHPVKLFLYKTWHKQTDIETFKLAQRRVVGRIVFQDGKSRKLRLKFIQMHMPPKQIRDMFSELDLVAKKKILDRKLKELSEHMEKEYGEEVSKIVRLVEHYTENPERFEQVGFMRGEKFVLNKSFMKLHDVTKDEKEELMMRIEQKMKTKMLFEEEPLYPEQKIEGDQNGIRENE